MFPTRWQYYTQFKGTRCALPMLADVYGLYYNKKLLAKAGIKQPPRTIAELAADAKKLTQRTRTATISVIGFNPFLGWYENAGGASRTDVRRRVVQRQGQVDMDTAAVAVKLLSWQKQLVDWYGYDNLVRFNAGPATSSRRRTPSSAARWR